MTGRSSALPFTILQFSSEDPEHPSSELMLQSPQARGWQSRKFSPFPQLLHLKLHQPAQLRKVSLLSHQSKIASTVEFYCRLSPEQKWKGLGLVKLGDNQQTQLHARQLRSAKTPNVAALYLRVVFRENHQNRQNIFNQVGVICVCFYGDPLNANELRHQPSDQTAPPEVDMLTANRIKQLEIKKAIAIESDDFDRAQLIKKEIIELRAKGAILLRLELFKKAAVQSENFQNAKILNEKIRLLRAESGLEARPAAKSSDGFRSLPQRTTMAPKPIAPSNSVPYMTAFESDATTMGPSSMNERPLDTRTRSMTVQNEQNYDNIKERPETNNLQELTSEIRAIFEPYFSVLEEETIQQAFSKNLPFRQEGLARLLETVKTPPQPNNLYLTACLLLLKSLVDDKVPTVCLKIAQFLQKLLAKLKPKHTEEHYVLVEPIVERMTDWLSHANAKLRTSTQDLFQQFQQYGLTKLASTAALALQPKRDKTPKITTSRLLMLQRIISQRNLERQQQQRVIDYAFRYADDKSQDARNAAAELIALIGRTIGLDKIEMQLKDLRPQIVSSIEQKMSGAPMSKPKNSHPNSPRSNSDRSGSQDKKEMPSLLKRKNVLQKKQQPIDTEDNHSSSRFKQSVNENRNIKGEANKKQFNTDNQQQKAFQPSSKTPLSPVDKKKEKGAKETKAMSNSRSAFCPYCRKQDNSFLQGEKALDMHFFYDCPYLTSCSECRQILQIPMLTPHLLTECSAHSTYKQCPRCQEAIPLQNYKTHLQRRQCLQRRKDRERCALCHLDVGPRGWQEHLIVEGCQNNPRK